MTFRFDVNLSIVLTEYPLLRRPRKAAECGFKAVELWWPFESPAPPENEVNALVEAIQEANVRLVSLNFDAGDMREGDRGLLSIPSHSQRFQENVHVAIDLADRLDCNVMNALYGNRDDEISAEAQDELAIENLSFAARAAEAIGATVVVEALNAAENPRYPLQRPADVISVLRRLNEVEATNVGLLFDVYHSEQMGDQSPALLRRYSKDIVHVQLADVPGRHQPGTGSIRWGDVFAALRETEYTGHVGLEYKPTGRSESSFEWIQNERWSNSGSKRRTEEWK